MRVYKFYGWQTADCKPVDSVFKTIENPRHFYDILSEIWCADTCAPRMREKWTRENQTLGQCSITAFFGTEYFWRKSLWNPSRRRKEFSLLQRSSSSEWQYRVKNESSAENPKLLLEFQKLYVKDVISPREFIFSISCIGDF